MILNYIVRVVQVSIFASDFNLATCITCVISILLYFKNYYCFVFAMFYLTSGKCNLSGENKIVRGLLMTLRMAVTSIIVM